MMNGWEMMIRDFLIILFVGGVLLGLVLALMAGVVVTWMF